jgi:hypothetical protein
MQSRQADQMRLLQLGVAEVVCSVDYSRSGCHERKVLNGKICSSDLQAPTALCHCHPETFHCHYASHSRKATTLVSIHSLNHSTAARLLTDTE